MTQRYAAQQVFSNGDWWDFEQGNDGLYRRVYVQEPHYYHPQDGAGSDCAKCGMGEHLGMPLPTGMQPTPHPGMSIPVNRSVTDEAARRKAIPICTGVLDYFPDALAEVARVSQAGNKQHALDTLRWDKSKSTDEADALVRHLLERGTLDTDGMRHTAKVAWRALALLQRELDAEKPQRTWSSPAAEGHAMAFAADSIRDSDATGTK